MKSIIHISFSLNQQICLIKFFQDSLWKQNKTTKNWKLKQQNIIKTSCSGGVSTRWHLCDQQTLKLSALPTAREPRLALKIFPIQFNGMLPPSSLTICLCRSAAVHHSCFFFIGRDTPQSQLKMGDHYLPPNSAASLSSDLINSNQPYSWSDGCRGLPTGGFGSRSGQEYKLGPHAEGKQNRELAIVMPRLVKCVDSSGRIVLCAMGRGFPPHPTLYSTGIPNLPPPTSLSDFSLLCLIRPYS